MTGPHADGELVTLLYTSNASTAFDDDALDALLTSSRRANAEQGITGMLLYRGGRFVQVLEGERELVLALLDRIRADERHADVRVLIDEPLQRRLFADWSMGYQPLTEPQEPLRPGFRSTFEDLDADGDTTATGRAARELSMWFRVRAGRSAQPAPAAQAARR